jgi:long-chain acyl-CoA synthetase
MHNTHNTTNPSTAPIQPHQIATQPSTTLQDKRELGALVFPDPDALAGLATARGLASPDELPADEVQSLLEAEVLTLNRGRGDFRAWEHIAHIAVMGEQLSPDNGTLTRSMKPRRPEIMKRYSAQVEGLRGRLRG